MSKYIIDIPKTVGMTEKVGSVHYTYFDGIQCKTIILKSDEIEELNSDYINEHFGELQDEAYLKGFKDGKKSTGKGCDGCEYENQKEGASPCCECARVCDDHYIPKRSDRIEVGDVVERYIDGKLDSKGIYLEEDDGYWRCLFDTGAILMTFAYPKEQFKKTGNHYDIQSILEAMRK